MNPTITATASAPAKQRPTRFQLPDGTIYRVGKGGAWIRESPRRCEARDYKDLHNNGVRRRQKK